MADQSFTRDFKVVVGEDRNKFDNIEVPGGLQDCGGGQGEVYRGGAVQDCG